MPFRPQAALTETTGTLKTLNELYNQHFNSLPEEDKSYFPAAFSALP
jgi:hypothetical protein